MYSCVLCKIEYNFIEIFFYENSIICPFCVLGYNCHNNYIYKKYKNNKYIRDIVINKIKTQPRLCHILKSIKFKK